MAAVPAPLSLCLPKRERSERIKALHELVDLVEELESPGRVAALRRLAEYSDDLLAVLDTIEGLMWALEEPSEIESALDSVLQHRRTLELLSELDFLAKDVSVLTRDVQEVRRHREELDWAIDELEDPEEDLP